MRMHFIFAADVSVHTMTILNFDKVNFGKSAQTLNIDSGPMSSYYVEYIFLSVIVGHTVLSLGKGQCPLSTVRVMGCPVDYMTFATSPVNFILLNNDIALKNAVLCVCSMPSNLDGDI